MQITHPLGLSFLLIKVGEMPPNIHCYRLQMLTTCHISYGIFRTTLGEHPLSERAKFRQSAVGMERS